jgi:hypothetical protein
MTPHPTRPQSRYDQNRVGLSARLQGPLGERASPGSTSIATTWLRQTTMRGDAHMSTPEFFDPPDTARLPVPTTTTAKLYA